MSKPPASSKRRSSTRINPPTPAKPRPLLYTLSTHPTLITLKDAKVPGLPKGITMINITGQALNRLYYVDGKETVSLEEIIEKVLEQADAADAPLPSRWKDNLLSVLKRLADENNLVEEDDFYTFTAKCIHSMEIDNQKFEDEVKEQSDTKKAINTPLKEARERMRHTFLRPDQNKRKGQLIEEKSELEKRLDSLLDRLQQKVETERHNVDVSRQGLEELEVELSLRVAPRPGTSLQTPVRTAQGTTSTSAGAYPTPVSPRPTHGTAPDEPPYSDEFGGSMDVDSDTPNSPGASSSPWPAARPLGGRGGETGLARSFSALNVNGAGPASGSGANSMHTVTGGPRPLARSTSSANTLGSIQLSMNRQNDRVIKDLQLRLGSAEDEIARLASRESDIASQLSASCSENGELKLELKDLREKLLRALKKLNANIQAAKALVQEQQETYDSFGMDLLPEV